MTDPHVMIIHYVSEVIGGKTVCFHDYRVPLHLNKEGSGNEKQTLLCYSPQTSHFILHH